MRWKRWGDCGEVPSHAKGMHDLVTVCPGGEEEVVEHAAAERDAGPTRRGCYLLHVLDVNAVVDQYERTRKLPDELIRRCFREREAE